MDGYNSWSLQPDNSIDQQQPTDFNGYNNPNGQLTTAPMAAQADSWPSRNHWAARSAQFPAHHRSSSSHQQTVGGGAWSSAPALLGSTPAHGGGVAAGSSAAKPTTLVAREAGHVGHGFSATRGAGIDAAPGGYCRTNGGGGGGWSDRLSTRPNGSAAGENHGSGYHQLAQQSSQTQAVSDYTENSSSSSAPGFDIAEEAENVFRCYIIPLLNIN